MRSRTLIRILSLICLVLLPAGMAYAQRAGWGGRGGRNGQGQGGGGPGKGSTDSGTVDAVATGAIRMLNSASQPVMVAIPPTAKVHYTGTATPDFLKAGMCVEFTAEVDKRGTVKEPLGMLTVFTPSAERTCGLFPEGAAGAGGGGAGAAGGGGNAGGFFGAPAADNAKGAAKPAAAPKAAGGDAGGFFGAPAPDNAKGAGKAGKTGKAAAPGPVQLPATCCVRGQLKSAHGKKLIVNAGKGAIPIHVELDASVQINVDVALYNLAVKGDTISVSGRSVGSAIQAETVTIQGTQPLTGAKKRGRADKGTAAAKRSKKDGDADAPPADPPPAKGAKQ